VRVLPTYSVVDIFAGPGGLAERFSSVPGDGDERAFSIALSIEKEASARETLRLRSFLRQFDGVLPAAYHDFINGKASEPDWAALYPDQWKAADEEAWQLELGKEDPAERLDARLDAILAASDGNVILIGGPPCQAYSLAGRSRNVGKEGYEPIKDEKHFLYREYIRILDRLNPAAFVMENVKGMLSSSVDGENRIFDQVLRDLRGDREGGRKYRLIALDPRSRQQLDLGRFEPRASDFIVRAEDFGVPQARHRICPSSTINVRRYFHKELRPRRRLAVPRHNHSNNAPLRRSYPSAHTSTWSRTALPGARRRPQRPS
jgi:DNA (cytosine-5)-methyltransferase 1